jgi:integrase
MGRPSKLWWWESGKCWASVVRGKRERLGKDSSVEGKARATRELHRLLAAEVRVEADPAESLNVSEILDRYNDIAEATLLPATYQVYQRRLREFKQAQGLLLVVEMRPRHVNEWIASKPWANTTSRTAVAIIKRAFAWATREGYIEKDPTKGVERPPDSKRPAIPTAEVVATLTAAARPTLRMILEAIIQTGCRPGEAIKATASDFDPVAGTWTFPGKTTRKTGRLRVVYLTPSVIEACKGLRVENPQGSLYRNLYGQPWTDKSLGDAVRRLRKKLGLGPEVVAYAMRHVFVTDALERGVPIATVAELMGHTNTAMISRYYSHLAGRTEHLRSALGKIRPEITGNSSGHTPPASGPVEASPSARPGATRRKPPGPKA